VVSIPSGCSEVEVLEVIAELAFDKEEEAVLAKVDEDAIEKVGWHEAKDADTEEEVEGTGRLEFGEETIGKSIIGISSSLQSVGKTISVL